MDKKEDVNMSNLEEIQLINRSRLRGQFIPHNNTGINKAYVANVNPVKDDIVSYANTIYPLTIITDRYNGKYSGGKYIAFHAYPSEINEEAFGPFDECIQYWEDNINIVGRGNTSDEAMYDLARKMINAEKNMINNNE